MQRRGWQPQFAGQFVRKRRAGVSRNACVLAGIAAGCTAGPSATQPRNQPPHLGQQLLEDALVALRFTHAEAR